MKTVFDADICDELNRRLDKLAPDRERKWGKMSSSQMMEHVCRTIEMASGEKPMKQLMIGKLLSWAFRKEFLGEQPFKPGRPTGKDFIIVDQPDFDSTRERLRALIGKFHGLGEGGTDGNVHGFFGPLTGKQWGETQYKHLDHHFRQFGI